MLLLLFWTRVQMINVYGHKEQQRCNESLRLIGGRSPGSQDSRQPRHPRALDDEELFIIEGFKKSAENRDDCKIQGAHKNNADIIGNNSEQLKHLLRAGHRP